MLRITDLKPCRRERGRIQVYLDGAPAFAVSLSDSATLQRGQFLDDAQVREYREADLRFQAYRAAVRHLGFRARTARQVEQELTQRGFSPPITAGVTERLRNEGLLNDAEYARRYVRERLRRKPRSSALLRQELRRKGIVGTAAEAALDSIDDDQVARRIVETHWPRWQRLSPERRKAKLLGYLRNRGFARDVCLRACRHAGFLPETSA